MPFYRLFLGNLKFPGDIPPSLLNSHDAYLRRQIANLDLDAEGQPLVTWQEAQQAIQAAFPDASEQDVRRMYRQYRSDTRTILFGGHRLTNAQFRTFLQENTEANLTDSQLDSLFHAAILDTLDGTDALERCLENSADPCYNNKKDVNRRAVIDYKSGTSYLINGKINGGVPLSPQLSAIADELDLALKNIPIYRGKVYRNIQFDEFGGKESLDAFVEKHRVGKTIRYPAFTSSSTQKDGYPLNGEFVVHIEIMSVQGRNLDGFGNNNESEVLFGRNSLFFVHDIIYDKKNTPTIILEEVNTDENDTGRLEGFSGRN